MSTELTEHDVFLHRLALALSRTVGELLDSISYPELLRWGKYYALEPFGEWPANLRAAQIVATLANINRDSKKRSKPYEITDFELFKRKPIPRKDPESVKPKAEPDEGAKLDPNLMGWLFLKARQNKESVPVPNVYEDDQ